MLSRLEGPVPDPYAKPPGSCALGYCRAPNSSRSRYCSVEHGELARDEQDAQAQDRRDVNAHLTRIARGEAPPILHAGVFTTTEGVVLFGDAVREMRTLMVDFRRALIEFERRLKRPGARLDELVREWDDTIRDLERRLLSQLDRLLPIIQISAVPEVTPRSR